MTKLKPGEVKTEVIMPEGLKRRVKALSALNGRGLQEEINLALAAWLDKGIRDAELDGQDTVNLGPPRRAG